MSQSDVAAVDPSNFDEECLIQHSDQLFNSKTANGLASSYGSCLFAIPPDSTALSSVPTPDLSDYSFGQSSDGHSTLNAGVLRPYPMEQQQIFIPRLAVFPLLDYQRPQPLRPQPNTSHLAPPRPPPGYARRRSLSQGDIDNINFLNAKIANPTFVRLQDPRHPALAKRRVSQHSRSTSRSRSRSPSSEDPKGKHVRNTSRISSGVGRPTERSDVATSLPSIKVPKRLGEPLSPKRPYYHRSVPTGSTSKPNEDITFTRMAGQKNMERSRKIIEIGAMAVTPPVDSTMEDGGVAILKKLDDVEQYLKWWCIASEDALKGCATIRAALKGKAPLVGVPSASSGPTNDTTQADKLDPPSSIMDWTAGSLTNNSTDDELEMDRLIRENTTPLDDAF
ncbi:hypothetical protein OPT61_g8291 [Boeremia exigua]|uniref:Uncharacterized protein n=1 Tax=Boeremia exigua TaxID=749465 RepID=A0ACC2HZ90_9PLEO|nr:hypothetical protein OPT61_g8291 [Boeremia exigua]